MSNKRPVLEVLIPTFNRPERAIEAIGSCLNIASADLRVSCHSNGSEPKLQAYADSCKDTRLRYGWFESNRGACANLRRLVDQAVGQYVLILSDEDGLDEAGILNLIRDLASHHEIGVALPVIMDCESGRYFFKSPLKPGLIDSTPAISLHAWESSYISGTVFNTDALRELDLNYLLRQSIANAYPHLSIKLFLLARNNKMFLPSYTVVLKRREETKGGDAYSHLVEGAGGRENKGGGYPEPEPRLNPDIYGDYARAMQFFSLWRELRVNRPYLSGYAVFWARMNLLITFSRHYKNPNDEQLQQALKELGLSNA
jgi:glycosyltransferase involved in cell wall biosynthesis